MTKRQPRLPKSAHVVVRPARLDDCPLPRQFFERFFTEFENAGLGFEISVVIAEPAQAQALEAADIEFAHVRQVVSQRKRLCLARAGHRAEQTRRVLAVSAHRSAHGQLEIEQVARPAVGDAAERGPETDYIVERARISQ